MTDELHGKTERSLPGLGGVGGVIFDLTGHKPEVSGDNCPECGGSPQRVTWRELAEFAEWLTERLHAEAVQPGANRYNPPPPETVTVATSPPVPREEPGNPFSAVVSSPQTAELNRTWWHDYLSKRGYVRRKSR